MRVVLVDNASSDGSVAWLRTHHPDVWIEHRPRNEGFALAINNAVHSATEDWLVVLNNDIRVEPDWLVNLLDAARELGNPCVSSHLLGWEDEATQFAGGSINCVGKGFESSEVLSGDPYEIFFPCGCGMAIRRDLFRNAGGFDSDYFMIYEDIDLGWRLRLLGHPVYFVPSARIRHRAHASLSNESYATKAICLERNSLATLYKNLGDEAWARMFPVVQQEALHRARALGGWGVPVPYHPDGVATIDGVRAFMAAMPKWREKRAWIQARRVVTDESLLQRWLGAPNKLWAYAPFHYERLHHPDVLPHLEAIHARLESIVCSTWQELYGPLSKLSGVGIIHPHDDIKERNHG